MLQNKRERYLFTNLYELIEIIDSVTNDEYFETYIYEIEESAILKKAVKFNRITLLHEFIYHTICAVKFREFRKNSAEYGISEIEDYEFLFNVREIEVSSFPREDIDYNNDEHDENYIGDLFYKWFSENKDEFELLYSELTDEVFHMLYWNRFFLRKFNLQLSNYIVESELIEHIPDKSKNKKGKIKRCNIPKWVQRAVYYRDQGRCVICNSDVTGLVDMLTRENFDHIVPLNLFGLNDPTNIQLLCTTCNSKKSGNSSSSDYYYNPWWEVK